MKDLPERIVMFDGVCNLCNGAVQFIIKQDPKAEFKFASLQSQVAQNLDETQGVLTDRMETIVYLRQGNVLRRSSAVLMILVDLGGKWRWLGWLGHLFPQFIRDGVYRMIARYRYKWFGRQETCRVPTPDEMARFLDVEKRK